MSVFSSAVYAKQGELEVNLIADNVYQHVSYERIKHYGVVGASGLVVVNQNQAVLIDTPWTQRDTEKLVTWFKNKGIRITTSVSTHFHQDRAGGISYLKNIGVATYASKQTNTLLSQRGKTMAEYSFDTHAIFTGINGIEVLYPGAGHSRDNIVIWLPETKLLFGGCLIRALSAKGLGFTGDGDITKWSGSVDKIIEQFSQINTVVPGHGAIGGVELLTHTKQLVEKKMIK